jgi:hypothetical protein
MIKVSRLPRRERERDIHTSVTYRVPISKHLAQKQIHNILQPGFTTKQQRNTPKTWWLLYMILPT